MPSIYRGRPLVCKVRCRVEASKAAQAPKPNPIDECNGDFTTVTRCFTCQRNDSLDVGERMRSWTYGCKPNEVPRAILSAFVLPTVPGKRPQ